MITQYIPNQETIVELNHLPQNTNIKICSWNVNGIRAILKKTIFSEFIQNGINLLIKKSLIYSVSMRLRLMKVLLLKRTSISYTLIHITVIGIVLKKSLVIQELLYLLNINLYQSSMI